MDPGRGSDPMDRRRDKFSSTCCALLYHNGFPKRYWQWLVAVVLSMKASGALDANGHQRILGSLLQAAWSLPCGCKHPKCEPCRTTYRAYFAPILENWDIQKESTLHLVLRLRGGPPLPRVLNLLTGETITSCYGEGITIYGDKANRSNGFQSGSDEVRSVIETKTSITPSEQRLFEIYPQPLAICGKISDLWEDHIRMGVDAATLDSAVCAAAHLRSSICDKSQGSDSLCDQLTSDAPVALVPPQAEWDDVQERFGLAQSCYWCNGVLWHKNALRLAAEYMSCEPEANLFIPGQKAHVILTDESDKQRWLDAIVLSKSPRWECTTSATHNSYEVRVIESDAATAAGLSNHTLTAPLCNLRPARSSGDKDELSGRPHEEARDYDILLPSIVEPHLRPRWNTCCDIIEALPDACYKVEYTCYNYDVEPSREEKHQLVAHASWLWRLPGNGRYYN